MKNDARYVVIYSIVVEPTRLKSAEADMLYSDYIFILLNYGQEGCCCLSEDGCNSLFFMLKDECTKRDQKEK